MKVSRSKRWAIGQVLLAGHNAVISLRVMLVSECLRQMPDQLTEQERKRLYQALYDLKFPLETLRELGNELQQ